ncbi:uncharacterized protein LOC100854566 isoform X4 [Vitis vinifera]|uniref:uncharacterized protein LOC100854566 isoform X4 n=1 Tax=Vitis vinifera TaxID=29760 RepID=UPI00053FA765|nr:uncharacterized protein LOC100854566 isoform X4 [Vitis vinifera]XP_010654311.1 uncharacterized protein LOC100854566 isoform X4 [Vitis vinifera]|eukprot:XP_010654310.1 PREDICTED: uncharacterized protein LOC100854566 isoform X4 [Vitis vinifera]
MASDSDPSINSNDSSSYFQQTVCLQDWWLIKSKKGFEGKRLAVAGLSSKEACVVDLLNWIISKTQTCTSHAAESLVRQRAVRVFSSAPIIKRYDVFTLETADGITVIIKGFINKLRTNENGFPSEVFNHFLFGFPPHWEEYAEKCFEGGSTSGFVSRSNPGVVSISTHDLDKLMMDSEKETNQCKKAINEARHENSEDVVEMKRKNNERSSPFEACENQDVGNLNRSSLTASAQSGKKMDISEDIPCQSEGQVSKCQSRKSNRKWQEGQKAEIGLKTKRKSFISVPVGFDHVNNTVGNISREIGGESISNLSDVGPQEHHNITVEKLDDECLKDGSQKNSEFPPAYTNAKCKQNHENIMIQAKIQSKNTNESVRPSTRPGQANQKIDLKTPVGERASSSGKKTKRKLDYNIQVTHPSIKERTEVSIVSPELLSLKRSRSGRLLLPSLDFWRNQKAVYDAVRDIFLPHTWIGELLEFRKSCMW